MLEDDKNCYKSHIRVWCLDNYSALLVFKSYFL